ARAMALDPDILFFDEPSSGLDPISSRRLDDLILELRDSLGATVVVVTHELASIFAIGTNSVFLDDETRTIIAAGHPTKLLHERQGRHRGRWGVDTHARLLRHRWPPPARRRGRHDPVRAGCRGARPPDRTRAPRAARAPEPRDRPARRRAELLPQHARSAPRRVEAVSGGADDPVELRDPDPDAGEPSDRDARGGSDPHDAVDRGGGERAGGEVGAREAS